jgi:3-dehydroquinate synthase
MAKKTFTFSGVAVSYYLDSSLMQLEKLIDKQTDVIITDYHVFAKNKKAFTGYNVIVIPPGEDHKTQSTVDGIISKLIAMGADRQSMLVGIGGGVITDITGYVAGIFMRGISFGFVPTSILAMVDASIGGKNGIDVGLHKNMVGLIRQPRFLLHDQTLLKTLPKPEWVNGFAEIIKHACIKDAAMFSQLEESKLSDFQKNSSLLAKLIQRNALLKTKVVVADEFENGERRQLNFGHTFGHAIENLYKIPHGHAVSIGIGIACRLSEKLAGFTETSRVISLLKKYGLPPQFEFDKKKVFDLVKSDKKKDKTEIHFVLLQKIGKAKVVKIPFSQIETLINEL